MSVAIIFIVDGEQEIAAQWPEIPRIGDAILFFHDIYADDGVHGPYVTKTLNATFRVLDTIQRSQMYNFNQDDGRFYVVTPEIKIFLETVSDPSNIIQYLQSPKA